jgi:hypothetical protein
VDQLTLNLDGLPATPLTKEAFKDAMQRLSPMAINALRDLMERQSTPPNIKLQAATVVMQHAYGKPRQEIEHRQNEEQNGVVLGMPADDITPEQWAARYGG